MQFGVRQHNRAIDSTDHRSCRNEKTVVRPDQYTLAGGNFERDHAPLRRDTGVDDCNDDTARYVLNCTRQHE
jgi:hypothetical protein